MKAKKFKVQTSSELKVRLSSDSTEALCEQTHNLLLCAAPRIHWQLQESATLSLQQEVKRTFFCMIHQICLLLWWTLIYLKVNQEERVPWTLEVSPLTSFLTLSSALASCCWISSSSSASWLLFISSALFLTKKKVQSRLCWKLHNCLTKADSSTAVQRIKEKKQKSTHSVTACQIHSTDLTFNRL